jgi:uncharacterized membrane protein (UPF0127 family)
MKAFAPIIAGLALVAAGAGADPSFDGLPDARLQVITASGTHEFRVWIAADDASRERGLMHVRELAPDRGMLFLFDPPQPVAFWMKDTPLSLDLVFIGPDLKVLGVAEAATPFSMRPIEADGPVTAVLEVIAGTARRIGIAPGDSVRLPTLRTTGTLAQPPAAAVSYR